MMNYFNSRAVAFSRIRLLLAMARIAAVVIFFVLAARLYGWL